MPTESLSNIVPSDGFAGTLKRTWIERDKGRVGRVFEVGQLDQIRYIHSLCEELADQGVRVQTPVGELQVVGDKVVCYYRFTEDNQEDYQDGWYSPVETSERRRAGARAFAKFQQVGSTLRGPSRPLDYPYSNTLEWIKDTAPIEKLLNPWSSADETVRSAIGVRQLEEVIRCLINRVTDSLDELPLGLCHGDYHSSNTIFRCNKIGQIVDFGFWVHHPMQFDLAIALEMWSRDWNSERFALDYGHFNEFLDEYADHGGPVRLEGESIWLLPLSRVWIETYGLRRLSVTGGSEVATRGVRCVLERLTWYLDNLEAVLGSSWTR